MADPLKASLVKQCSLSHIEQSLKITPTPPQQAPVTISPGPKAGNFNLSKVDLEIADRLAKLRKRSTEVVPTEEEMAARLAQLKGLPADHYTKPSYKFYQPKDIRTQAEKSEDLLKQVMEEVALDAKVCIPEFENHNAVLCESKPSSINSASLNLNETKIRSPDSCHFDNDEVAALMKDVEKELKETAAASFSSLQKDEELKKALQNISKRNKSKKSRKQRTNSESTSSEERLSDCAEQSRKPKPLLLKEDAPDVNKEEVDRIVQLYTQKAREKKEKRRKRATKKREAVVGRGSSSDTSEENSNTTDSDDGASTSESEKLSN